MSTDWKARAEKAEARPTAYIVHSPEDEIYGTGPDKLQFHPLAERDIESGYTQTALYAAPVPRLTVTDEMVERAAKIYAKRVLGSDEGWRRAKVDVRRAYTALARAALTAALENRHD